MNEFAVKPNQIDTGDYFFGSGFGNSEIETLARNIVLILKKHGDWIDFSFNQYKELCTHEVSNAEQYLLDTMAEKGWLKKYEGIYSITSSFLEAISEFIDTPERRKRKEEIRNKIETATRDRAIRHQELATNLVHVSTYSDIKKYTLECGFKLEHYVLESGIYEVWFGTDCSYGRISCGKTLEEAAENARLCLISKAN